MGYSREARHLVNLATKCINMVSERRLLGLANEQSCNAGRMIHIENRPRGRMIHIMVNHQALIAIDRQDLRDIPGAITTRGLSLEPD